VLASAYQVQVAKKSCVWLMETTSWRDILVLIRRMQRFPMHITGQICLPTWHISYALVRCALHPKVRINCVWGQNLSHPSHFNHHQLGFGFDRTTAGNQEWTHMDCHLGRPYIQNDCGSSSQRGTNVFRSVGAHDISGDLLQIWITSTSHD